MTLLWIDSRTIAIELNERYPEYDVAHIRFTDLWKMVQELPGFSDDPQRSNEKVLEAIQMAWLDEQN